MAVSEIVFPEGTEGTGLLRPTAKVLGFSPCPASNNGRPPGKKRHKANDEDIELIGKTLDNNCQ